jgi:glutamate-1-semialdehyde 2,1-aminomutase
MDSRRLPGKVMKKLGDRALIEILFERLSQAKSLDGIVVATTRQKSDDCLVRLLRGRGIPFYRGSAEDVLSRFVSAAKRVGAEAVVRITGDCPLVDGQVVDAVVTEYRKGGADYVSNVDPPTFPDGLDVEVFSSRALEQAHRTCRDRAEREHVTPWMRNNSRLKKRNVQQAVNLSRERWTVDEPEDLEVVERIFRHFAPDRKFSWKEVVRLKKTNPDIFQGNQGIARNQGRVLGAGQKLWKRAKRVIPGGNMLLSKRAEMFLPDQWPAYFKRARGCFVWDLDGKKYVDLSMMGIGTNILGYSHPTVDAAVRQAAQQGNMSTLNCPEEVFLAEKLVEIHPWADMVRLARSGGEANAIAIRIARAATGRDKVAVCGYHGWHDWYLSANLADDRHLDGHLLPGLEPRGVPRNLRGTVFPFRYNQFEELETLVRKENIGVIKMEVERNEPPRGDYLQKIRKLSSDQGIVLVFDECTSGFRETFGGLHKKYGVEPDMAMFGKALGNGYAITAVIGRRSVMEAAQTSFISSTFWTERIGPTAALRCLEVMEKERAWEKISATGILIRKTWERLAKKHGLEIQISGLAPLPAMTFAGSRGLLYKTLFTQEMLKRGYLGTPTVYACLAHTPKILEKYFQALEPVFRLLAECEDGRDPQVLLQGPVCHSGFQRLN